MFCCCRYAAAGNRLHIEQVQLVHELMGSNVGTKGGKVQQLQPTALLLLRLQRL